MITVPPAKATALPEVAQARAIDSFTSIPRDKPTAVAGDDEERVVDPDA